MTDDPTHAAPQTNEYGGQETDLEGRKFAEISGPVKLDGDLLRERALSKEKSRKAGERRWNSHRMPIESARKTKAQHADCLLGGQPA